MGYVEKVDRAAADLFVLPSRRGINPRDPGFDPEEFLDKLCEEAMSIQRETLREILGRNAEVEYLQRHRLGGRTDVESFRQCVPVVSYGDLEEDIMKLVQGEDQDQETPIFTVDPIIHFDLSSGTTAGRLKYFLKTSRAYYSRDFLEGFKNSLVYRCFQGFEGGKCMSLQSTGMRFTTPSGLMAGGSTSNYFASPFFKNRVRDPKNESSSPDAAVLCKDAAQSLYCHLLCALSDSTSIVKLYSFFASIMIGAIRALQKEWPEIVEDIRTGKLNKKITDPELRSEVEEILTPNAEQAGRVEMECSKEDWAGIIPRLFPNAHYLECATTGSMSQYGPALKHFAGHLPNVSTSYASSECNIFGFNPNPCCLPKDVTYMLWPESAYYEFIPFENPNERSDSVQVLEACDLEVGKEYELLVTTPSGLYRYLVGDILRVRRFIKNYPTFEFVQSKGVLLSVDMDKTDEVELQVVIEKASRLLEETSMNLVDYTSIVDFSSIPGHYVVYWEIKNNGNLDESVLQKCANTIDESFSLCYQNCRKKKAIAPLELRILKEGTVDELRVSAVTPSQYKLPRLVSTSHLLNLLNGRTLVSFRSTATSFHRQLGHWTIDTWSTFCNNLILDARHHPGFHSRCEVRDKLSGMLS